MSWFLNYGWWIIIIILIVIDEVGIYLKKQARIRRKKSDESLDNLFKKKNKVEIDKL